MMQGEDPHVIEVCTQEAQTMGYEQVSEEQEAGEQANSTGSEGKISDLTDEVEIEPGSKEEGRKQRVGDKRHASLLGMTRCRIGGRIGEVRKNLKIIKRRSHLGQDLAPRPDAALYGYEILPNIY
jgi:hypothetical protein